MAVCLPRGLKIKNDHAAATHICPSCQMKQISIFYEVKGVPVNSVMNFATRKEAVNYPRGDIVLGFCSNCGFVSNVAFDASMLRYTANCEESQGFSETFNQFSHRLAEYLIEKYNLHGKDILEIGCGKGDFLTLLCNLGKNRGVGFDPAYVPGRNPNHEAEDVTFIQDFYSEDYVHYQADFVCCQMTLEHIHNTAEFVCLVRRAIGKMEKTIVFFQVPDVTRILRNSAFEDIYYEHCSYFSPGSLGKLFRRCHFDVLHLATEYDHQYLIIETKPAAPLGLTPLPQEDDIQQLKVYVNNFTDNYQKKLSVWHTLLEKFRSEGKRVVLWGSGSKAVSFLTTLKVSEGIDYVVDINPHRQGTFMAGTGQKIVAPELLKQYRPHTVVVMNNIYLNEIRNTLSTLGITAEVMTL